MFDEAVVERVGGRPPDGDEEHLVARRNVQNDDRDEHGGKKIF